MKIVKRETARGKRVESCKWKVENCHTEDNKHFLSKAIREYGNKIISSLRVPLAHKITSRNSNNIRECISTKCHKELIPLFTYCLIPSKKAAFTLAEVLITLAIIGVVAAVTLPTLMTNVQQRVQNERAINAKYKITQATDKMKSMGLLEETYPTTQDFINEFKKHFKIAKVCDNGHLRDCWPTDKITAYNESGVLEEVSVTSLTTGEHIIALAPGTKNTTTMGIITGDGTPMIMVYSPKCSPLDPAKTYTWTTEDNKPVTNATANCISAIIDTNGKAKPNRVGKDVRTFNSLFGYRLLSDYEQLASSSTGYLSGAYSNNGYVSHKYEQCEKLKDKLGIKYCRTDGAPDYWGGARKACYDLGLHLPSRQTLSNIAGSRYGVSNVEPDTYIVSRSCSEYMASTTYKSNLKAYGSVVCIDTGDSNTITNDTLSSLPDTIATTTGINAATFWSSSEVSATHSWSGYITTGYSYHYKGYRTFQNRALCLGD